MNPRCLRGFHSVRWALAGLLLTLAPPASAQTTTGATFGDVIRLPGGTPSDIVLDQYRHQLYLVNNTTSQVYIFDYNAAQVVGSIAVGKSPLAGAISMDDNWLYVTSGATPAGVASGSPLLNVIDLSSYQVAQSVVLPSIPQGVEVGNDGRVLIGMLGNGVVSGVPQNTLAVFDPTLVSSQQLLPVTVPALPAVPSPLPATTLTRPTKIWAGGLLRTPDGQFIVGVIPQSSSTSTYIFVYQVASGVVLRNRTVAGASSVLSMAPDGSKFMAGMALYDITTLNVIAQESNTNAPFTFTGVFNTAQNVGGSAFSPDGSTLYAAFNTAANTTPAPPPSATTLLVNDPTNLAIRLGINLPESIVAKMVILSDGSQAWGASDSGILHLPLGNLYTYPIISPETTEVFLAMDDCDRGVARGALNINNLGQGRLTFSVVAPGTAAVVYEQSSGLAPATVTFTMDPGRSGVTYQQGTNMWTGAGTETGSAINVTLSSPQAINIPPTIRVYMNFRQPSQRGMIYPVPTGPNGAGLQDIVYDASRSLVYIANSAYNRIEVFDAVQNQFDNPIPVGQLPGQMAMSTDGNTLYVANTGGESISIVDLNLGKVVDNVQFPPTPRQGNAAVITPHTIAMGLFGLQFLMSDGSQWEVVNGDQATVRPADSVTPVKFAGTPNVAMLASPDNTWIITMNGSGLAYLYDATQDAYVTSRQLITSSTGGAATTIEGYYGVLGAAAGGSFFLVDGLITDPSLVPIGGSAQPGATSTTVAPGGGGGIAPGGGATTTVINTGNRNVAAVAPLGTTAFLRLTTPVRQSITSTTTDNPATTLEMVNLLTGEDTLAAIVPENPSTSVFGTTRANVNPRWMVTDPAGATAYAITLSGLSVIPLATAGANTLPSIGAVVNAADGSANLRPGSFITVTGNNLASTAAADTTPPPTMLGGSCVTFGDVSLPLLSTSPGQIQAQIPDNMPTGTQVVEVRSLATAQDSAPVLVTVKVNP